MFYLADAKNDLKDIYDYISLDSVRFAKLQISKIQKRTEILKTFPNSGKVVPEINDLTVKEITEHNYRIIYKIINKNQVDILLIHHGARDFKRRIIK
ncbi:MAG: type II toxin-antitoxin system RelE/ParE family toxin [Chitinophagales bacterium]